MSTNGQKAGAISIIVLLLAMLGAIVAMIADRTAQPVPCSQCITPVPIVSVIIKATATPTVVPAPAGTNPVPISTKQPLSFLTGGTAVDCAAAQSLGDNIHVSVDWPAGQLAPTNTFAGSSPPLPLVGVLSCGDGRHVEYQWLTGIGKPSFTWGN